MLLHIVAFCAKPVGTRAEASDLDRVSPKEKVLKSSYSPREQLRPLVPKLIELTEDVLFADVWERPGLSKRDRSLATVTALITSGRWDQMNSHLERATKHGITREEISELITHLAFYAGWASAMTAALRAKEFYDRLDAGKDGNSP